MQESTFPIDISPEQSTDFAKPVRSEFRKHDGSLHPKFDGRYALVFFAIGKAGAGGQVLDTRELDDPMKLFAAEDSAFR